ncbi:hypothetical protein D3C77_226060 [compost metagenome]
MRIKLVPIGSSKSLKVIRSGDLLVVNDEPFDFSPLLEGATLPETAILSEWFVAPVERVNGQLQITLRLPHADDAPHAALFPADIVNPPSGRVPLPTDVAAEPPAQESEA